jgi:hypothetical protein
VRNALDNTAISLEIGPQIVVRLLFVKVKSLGICIQLIKEELVGVDLIPKDIYAKSGTMQSFCETRKIRLTGLSRLTIYSFGHVPNRMQPGSLREFSAFVCINFKNSSIRSGWISASTITPKGLDWSSVDAILALVNAGLLWLLARKAWDEQRTRNQVNSFILVAGE